jgi:hypothetical protein
MIIAKYTGYKEAVLRILSALDWYKFVLKRSLRQDYVKKNSSQISTYKKSFKDVRYLHTHRVGLFE